MFQFGLKPFPTPVADLSVLSIPEGFSERECDGCGTGWNEPIVPDTIYLLNIRPACCVHDFEYSRGGEYSDFERANKRFLNNLVALIDSVRGWWYPKALARVRAKRYFEAVELLGWGVFKNNNKGDKNASKQTLYI